MLALLAPLPEREEEVESPRHVKSLARDEAAALQYAWGFRDEQLFKLCLAGHHQGRQPNRNALLACVRALVQLPAPGAKQFRRKLMAAREFAPLACAEDVEGWLVLLRADLDRLGLRRWKVPSTVEELRQ